MTFRSVTGPPEWRRSTPVWTRPAAQPVPPVSSRRRKRYQFTDRTGDDDGKWRQSAGPQERRSRREARQGGQEAQHPRDLGRRHRHLEPQLLLARAHGLSTPNIDRLAREGMLFTDSYGEQSCTAGRSSFITGQSVYRTGLSKVGLPAAPVGMNEKLVTIAAVLKEQGYATGQFGKNHLGDLNNMLPTNHGFDEFFGNLYHLNAEEEHEMANYTTDEDIHGFRDKFGPSGVNRSRAEDMDDKTV